jgi:hypothetical protein
MPNSKYGNTTELRVHAYGHTKYNKYVKAELDLLDRICRDDDNDDTFKYKFWLFYTHLKESLNNNSVDIPWK